MCVCICVKERETLLYGNLNSYVQIHFHEIGIASPTFKVWIEGKSSVDPVLSFRVFKEERGF